jgi:hypothetical protein
LNSLANEAVTGTAQVILSAGNRGLPKSNVACISSQLLRRQV